jgi:hypothetical protein
MHRVGFIAMGPGSANCLLPLIKEIENRQEVVLIALHSYVSTLWSTDEFKGDLEAIISTLDILFYGTGSGNQIETLIPKIARKYKVESISIMDIFWSKKEEYKKRFPVVPDWIVVTTEENKNDIICKIDISKDATLVLGNPHFDRLKKIKIKKKMIDGPLDVVYFSQPSSTSNFSETSEESKKAIKELIEIKMKTNVIKNITYCKHPRENNSFYKELNLKVETRDSFEVMLEKDLNIGCGTTLQYESMMLGINTIFYSEGNLKEQIMNFYKIDDKNNTIKKTNATKNIIEFFDL